MDYTIHPESCACAAYILDTFPIVKRKDEQQYGTYRTRDQILAIYDAMQQSIDSGKPYQTLLDPPPVDHALCPSAKDFTMSAQSRNYISIDELTPYESSVLRGSYEYISKLLKDGREAEVKPVKILELAGEKLVRNGNSTTLAFRHEGKTEVPYVVDLVRSSAEEHQFTEVLQHHIQMGMKGFHNLPIDPNDGARRARAIAEEQEIQQRLFMERLQENLKSKPPESP
jgi:hypothetical protein